MNRSSLLSRILSHICHVLLLSGPRCLELYLHTCVGMKLKGENFFTHCKNHVLKHWNMLNDEWENFCRRKSYDWGYCSVWICSTEYLNAFVAAWSFVNFSLFFEKVSVTVLDLHFEVNLTGTCQKLERKWEDWCWKASFIFYSVVYSERMAGGNHFQHAFALFLFCCMWPFALNFYCMLWTCTALGFIEDCLY